MSMISQMSHPEFNIQRKYVVLICTGILEQSPLHPHCAIGFTEEISIWELPEIPPLRDSQMKQKFDLNYSWMKCL